MDKQDIVLLASGTRGDIAPYLALGLGLRRSGCPVRVATHVPFRGIVEHCGLPFTPLEGNPSELMSRSGGQSALTYDGSPLRSLRASLRFYRQARPLFERLLTTAWKACQGAGVVLAGLPTTWGVHIAEALGVPCVWGFLQPFSRTRCHPSALLPFTFSAGGAYNAFTHRLVEQLTWLPWRGTINRWRKGMLRLPPAPLAGPFSGLYDPSALVLYGYSPRLSPPAPDWPPNHHVTGYWFLDENLPWDPPGDLANFLQEKPSPIFVGFGSPGARRPRQAVEVVLQALKEAGLRAVFALPVDDSLDVIPLSPAVIRIREASHAWLFERVAAAVHHGGAGTTGTSLRAGLPTLILPLAIDQFFWGDRVAALGVGPRPIPQRSLEPGRLAEALSQLTQDAVMRARAQQLGRAIREERGVEHAVELIRYLCP